MSDEGSLAAYRAEVEKVLADCDGLIAQMGRIARANPDVAPKASPDAIADVYAWRRWAQKALAALDRGEQVPPHPGA
jgi:hypothetical protein